MHEGFLFTVAGILITYLSVKDLNRSFHKETGSGKSALIGTVFIGLAYLIIGLAYMYHAYADE